MSKCRQTCRCGKPATRLVPLMWRYARPPHVAAYLAKDHPLRNLTFGGERMTVCASDDCLAEATMDVRREVMSGALIHAGYRLLPEQIELMFADVRDGSPPS
jgi:hypothetical protein